jgi:hypothetical protein
MALIQGGLSMFHSKENKEPFFVEKMEWEYGEKYGHVFYPKNLEEFQNKLDELDKKSLHNGKPFYVEILCINSTEMGVILGHNSSVLHFGEILSKDENPGERDSRLDFHLVDSNNFFYIEYSYRGAWSEAESKQLLPKSDVLKAVYQYIETQKLPSYIKFTRQDFNDKYVQSD